MSETPLPPGYQERIQREAISGNAQPNQLYRFPMPRADWEALYPTAEARAASGSRPLQLTEKAKAKYGDLDLVLGPFMGELAYVRD